MDALTKVYADPGPPPEGAPQSERSKWQRDNERFLTEGGRAGVSQLPASVDPSDHRLKQLRGEHTRFLEMHSPFKAALWLELLRPEAAVLHDDEQARRFRAAQTGADAGAFVTPDRPSITGIAQRVVASALRGDNAAISQIADRIEGKSGLRVGDEDPDDPQRRRQAAEIAESIIRKLTAGRIAEKKPGDDAKVIDVTPQETT